MNHTIRDWSKVLFIAIFMPVVVMIAYLAVGGNNTSTEVSLYIVLGVFLIFIWAIFNTLIGYNINEAKETFSYPHFYNLLRKKVDLKKVKSHEVIGFNEEAQNSKGYGFRKFKITIYDADKTHRVYFNREQIAQEVNNKLTSLMITKGLKK